jgi:signal transduction histidine kinase
MMHQIRTPLNIIGGFSQVLDENFHEMPPDEAERILQMMQDNTRKIVRINRMLVGYSSQKGYLDLTKERFSCNDLCREAMAGLRLNSPYTVRLRFETSLPDDFTICTDKQRVRLILEELLDNANKFTHHGTITVSCSQPDDKTVAITVSDTGIGIEKANREMIFAQFAKVDLFTEGVGLGLPLSKRAAQRIGGDLVLDAESQEGATFILTIPIA